ncbi:MauE/DoxX family redox-associated membrane protein [Marinobacter sp. JSM 1782161]|uniref:MauE/DoxX family redox-associated membrane protein n=1 Tax=Marinobacter sp. JSM 1782161 TaxID=2685906 RepID=UPI001401D7F5|nr:MauE/DoxX family redox-associated membrane protein [Marinobacter sp. JSM 1782161]
MSGVAGLFSLTFLVFTLLLFLRAFTHKLFDFDEFQGFLADYELLPESLVRPAGMALVALEGVTVLALVFAASRPIGLFLAIALLALYATAIGINLRRGNRRIECGCGGAPQWLSRSLLVRNGVLGLLALVPLTAPPLETSTPGVIAAIAAGLCLWVLYTLFEQANANLVAMKARQH